MAAAAVKPLGPTMQPTPQKVRPTPEPRESRAKRPGALGPALRIAISLVIVWHFAGVFLAALSIPVSSPLVMDLAQHWPMQWYLDALYMNQGHSFFAPDVGPGHFIEYQVYDQSGREIEKGELPSRKGHWPRLRYHRHFMLADQAGMPSDDKKINDEWQRKYLEAYARHLLRVDENAYTVRVRRVAHWPLPWRFVYEDGMKLTDPKTYETLMEVTQRRSDLRDDPADQANMWQGGPVDTAGRWGGPPR
jgi:hypothetical protein